jgi:DnaJ family protein A protein 5
MGASQSSSNDTADTAPAQEAKTSYYELLGVERQATEDELKKAYRKKALLLHPDKNRGDEERATKTFAEVQAAYEVLSDPQERAWYDSHETSILRGDGPGAEDNMPTYQNVRMTTADDLARLVRKFNSNVEFTDSPSGFFGFVRETFEQLATEEEVAAQWEDVNVRSYPTFGHKDDSHDDVVKQFYSAWAGFATVKTFAWRDKYRLSEAPDRRIRRLMEKENNAERQDGIREFNEAVRVLVAFIRKRDPRYTPNTQSEEDRQKALRDAATAQRARARAVNEAKIAEAERPEWDRFREVSDEEDESEEEEPEQEIIECVACDKEFKSERQYEAHEKSKKHQKAVQALQRKMKKDNAKMDLDSVVGSGTGTPQVDEADYEFIDEDPFEIVDEESHTNESVQHEEVDDMEARDDDTTSEISSPNQDSKPVDTDKSVEHPAAYPFDQNPSDSDSDYASPSTIRTRLEATTLSSSKPTSLAEDEAPESTKPKMGKAALKRAKKAAASAEHDEGPKCASCNETFPSRGKLFKHLEDPDNWCQPALKSAASGGGGGSGGGKGKKGKGKR